LVVGVLVVAHFFGVKEIFKYLC